MCVCVCKVGNRVTAKGEEENRSDVSVLYLDCSGSYTSAGLAT